MMGFQISGLKREQFQVISNDDDLSLVFAYRGRLERPKSHRRY
jgi:hypothetical protein